MVHNQLGVRNHYIEYLATIQPSSDGILQVDSGILNFVYRRITNAVSAFTYLPRQKEGGTIEATLSKSHPKMSFTVVKTTET
jgi:hypothetical protein